MSEVLRRTADTCLWGELHTSPGVWHSSWVCGCSWSICSRPGPWAPTRECLQPASRFF